jgi:CRISPR-associated protein Cmr5
MDARKTLEQQRAASAWANVTSVPREKGKQYGSLARGLAAMIQTNGLGQTLAFLLSKAGNDRTNAHARLYGHLDCWLSQNVTHGTDLLQWITQQSSDGYRRASVEALAYSVWLARFAEAKGWGQEQLGGENDSAA